MKIRAVFFKFLHFGLILVMLTLIHALLSAKTM